MWIIYRIRNETRKLFYNIKYAFQRVFKGVEMNAIVNELVDLGLAVIVDGYEESKKYLLMFETKYEISSLDFFNYYYEISSLSMNIPEDDESSWIFNCNCFISCGGKLNDWQTRFPSNSYLVKEKNSFIDCYPEKEVMMIEMCFHLIHHLLIRW